MTEHIIDARRIHHRWDSSLEPSLEIDSGDIVSFELAMAGEGQVRQHDRIEDTDFDFDTLYNLLGPVWIRGAEPGMTLQIEILSLQPGPWGWTVILPDFGLLPEDFPDPYLRTFDLTGADVASLTDTIHIPLSPFLGTMGVHPGSPDVAPPFPPHRGGGNIDNKHLTKGSALRLPIWCEGALFSCGDPHAAQGDGEVCVSAIECAMNATLRFRLLDDAIPTPMYSVPSAESDSGGYVGTMGIADDLLDCSRAAVRSMITWLIDTRGLTREDAYVLCSLAGDLRIHEVVDAGMWNVGFTIPHAVIGPQT